MEFGSLNCSGYRTQGTGLMTMANVVQKAQTDLGAIATGGSITGVSQLEAAQLAEVQQVTDATTAVQNAQDGPQDGASGKRHMLQVPNHHCHPCFPALTDALHSHTP